MKLEELARQSSVAARTSVSRLEPPPIGRPSIGRRLAPVGIAAGLLAVVAGGLFVLVRDEADDTLPADQIPEVTDLPHLGLPIDAAGWTPSFASELDDIADDAVVPPAFTYYGRSDADDPFADGDLVIGVLAGTDASDLEGDPVTVRGTTGVLLDPTGMPTDVVGVGWTEVDPTGEQLEVMLASRSSTVDELVAIADGLIIDVDAATAVPDESVGLDRLNANGSGSFLGFARGSQRGSFVTYEGDGTVIVSTVAGDARTTATELRWWTSDARTVAVGEHEGIAAELPDPGDSALVNRIVMWAPEPGVVASLTYYGSSDAADPVELAASVVELDPAEWASLVDAAATPSTPAMDVVFASDDGEIDGERFAWAIGLRDGDLCVELAEGTGSSGSCQDPDQATPPASGARSIDNMFAEHVGLVVIAADAIVEDVVDPAGVWTVVSVSASPSTDDGLFFMAFGPADVQPTFDVIVGGEVVDTLDAATSVVEDGDGATVDVGLDGAAGSGLDEVIGEGGGEIDGVTYSWTFGRQAEEMCLDLSIVAGDGGSGAGVCRPVAELVSDGASPPAVLSHDFGNVRVAAFQTTGATSATPLDERNAVQPSAPGATTWLVVVGSTSADGSVELVVDGLPRIVSTN